MRCVCECVESERTNISTHRIADASTSASETALDKSSFNAAANGAQPSTNSSRLIDTCTSRSGATLTRSITATSMVLSTFFAFSQAASARRPALDAATSSTLCLAATSFWQCWKMTASMLAPPRFALPTLDRRRAPAVVSAATPHEVYAWPTESTMTCTGSPDSGSVAACFTWYAAAIAERVSTSCSGPQPAMAAASCIAWRCCGV